MEILDISAANFTTNLISILIKYKSGKTGSINIRDGEIMNNVFNEGVKNKIISLIAKDSYKWLKAKYRQIAEEEKQEDDIEYCLRDYEEEKKLLKRIHQELKKLYINVA